MNESLQIGEVGVPMIRRRTLDRAEKRGRSPRLATVEVPRLRVVAAFAVARGARERATRVGVEDRMPRVLAAHVGQRDRSANHVRRTGAVGAWRDEIEARGLSALKKKRSV